VAALPTGSLQTSGATPTQTTASPRAVERVTVYSTPRGWWSGSRTMIVTSVAVDVEETCAAWRISLVSWEAGADTAS
jgi:hypothetical protein